MGSLHESLFENCLAVVGSRKMSPYGEKVIQFFFSELSRKVTIISGFSKGVDSKAHSEALAKGLKTIAVLPCGLDFVFPKEHLVLYHSILDSGGLVLSEYSGSMGPRTWTYLRRNRIVAGLSQALLVVEASEKSGSLNTANLAHLYNRDVLAVPGNIFSEISKGCLQLIKQNAKMVISGFDINDTLGLSETSLFRSTEGVLANDSSLRSIIATLKAFPLNLDDLSVFLSTPIPILSSKVTQLCLDGLIKESEGKFYAC